ncbi:MAG: hypothetical protein H6832_15395 [Planctomycetes bacterium]|nr:hypothetical protein [Planctomycetota bacterium]
MYYKSIMMLAAGTIGASTISQNVIAQTRDGVASSSVDAKRSAQHPVFLSTDVLFGCKVMEDGERHSKVSDALVDVSTGNIEGVITKNGQVYPFHSLTWNPETKCFERSMHAAPNTHEGTAHVAKAESAETADEVETADRKAEAANQVEPETPAPVDASTPLPATKSKHAVRHSTNSCYMLSKLVEYPLVGYEQTTEGRKKTEIGSIGGAFIDARSGKLAYVSTSVGGVLGIGAESRVIPWSAVEVKRNVDGDQQIVASLTAQRLEKAPAYGEGPDNLNNPEYRDSLYSYYGTDRADFEPARNDAMSLMTLSKVLGAEIVRGNDKEDSLSDLILNPENGQITHAICENGGVVPIGALQWDAKDKRFRIGQDTASVDVDASAPKVLASTLSDYMVMCTGEECGDLEDFYFDAKTNRFAYIAVAYDGMRVLPWRSATLTTSEPRKINLSCSKEAMKSAPELDGKVGATIYSPAFRERVEAIVRGD